MKFSVHVLSLFCLFSSTAFGSAFQQYQSTLHHEFCNLPEPDAGKRAACICIQEENSLTGVLECVKEHLNNPEGSNDKIAKIQKEIQVSRWKMRNLKFDSKESDFKAVFEKRFPGNHFRLN